MTKEDHGFPVKMAWESYRYLQEQIEKQKERIRDQTAMLLRMSYEDSLTGVYNRNKFNEIMEPDWSRISPGWEWPILISTDLRPSMTVRDTVWEISFSAVRLSSCGTSLRTGRTAQAAMSLLWWMTRWRKLRFKRLSAPFCREWSRWASGAPWEFPGERDAAASKSSWRKQTSGCIRKSGGSTVSREMTGENAGRRPAGAHIRLSLDDEGRSCAGPAEARK